MSLKKTYQGTVVPLVTPLTETYQLDTAAVGKILAHLQVNDAIPFILGTTGESVSLPMAVKKQFVREAVRLKADDTMLYAGISSSCFEEAIKFGRFCFDEGVDVVVATLPSYYALSESESQMKQYFEDMANQIGGPLIIYNIPATTHMSIPLPIIDELSHHAHIVGVKDSERSEDRLNASLTLWAKRADFSYFLGWAAKSAYALLHGIDGLVPSTGNLFPGIYRDMIKAVQEGNTERAYLCQKQSDVFGNLYQAGKTLGESLWALKVLMQEYDLCGPTVMPPLQSLSDKEAIRLRQTLTELVEKEEIQFNV